VAARSSRPALRGGDTARHTALAWRPRAGRSDVTALGGVR